MLDLCSKRMKKEGSIGVLYEDRNVLLDLVKPTPPVVRGIPRFGIYS